MSTEPAPPTLPGIDPSARIFNFLGHCASLHHFALASVAEFLRMPLDTAERFFSMDSTRMLLSKLAVLLESRTLDNLRRASWERWLYEVGDVVRQQSDLETMLVSGGDIEISDARLAELVGRCGELGVAWLELTNPEFARQLSSRAPI